MVPPAFSRATHPYRFLWDGEFEKAEFVEVNLPYRFRLLLQSSMETRFMDWRSGRMSQEARLNIFNSVYTAYSRKTGGVFHQSTVHMHTPIEQLKAIDPISSLYSGTSRFAGFNRPCSIRLDTSPVWYDTSIHYRIIPYVHRRKTEKHTVYTFRSVQPLK